MKKLVTVALVCISITTLFAQEEFTKDIVKNAENSAYEFEIIKDLEATAVQNQYRSSTCWSFSTTSFIESELMRIHEKKIKLSEMFIVRNTYSQKADEYVRMHGNFNFGAGGAFHDVTNMMKEFGMVPIEVYSSYLEGEEKHIHSEMDKMLKAMVDVVIKNPNRKLSKHWKKAYESVLDAYLGKIPEEFDFDGKTYTPKSFGESLDLNLNDYVEIGSYTHKPLYEKFILKVPDNWMLDEIYNVTLDDFAKVLENAIMNGYTVAWGGDVSEKGFNHGQGLAIIPEKEWKDMRKTEMDSCFIVPQIQKEITPEMRQEQYDNYQTQDDHGMHIVGIAKDQNGTKYYKVKNSWGDDTNDLGGYFYASEAYVLLKSIDIMVHKDAVPKDIRKKLSL